MNFENQIQPADCSSMEEIRKEIDSIDKTIIELIGKRHEYVLEASKFKTSESNVRAPERFEEILIQRRGWAMMEGLNPDVIEKLYRGLINYFIDEEMSKWRAEQKHNGK